MYLRELVEVARKGAELKRPDYPEYIFTAECDLFFIRSMESRNYEEVSLCALKAKYLDNRWGIAKPHPGACKECNGLGWYYRTGTRISCGYCNKTGDATAPPEEKSERDEDHDREICKKIVKQGNCAGINCYADGCPFDSGGLSACRNPVEQACNWLKTHPKENEKYMQTNIIDGGLDMNNNKIKRFFLRIYACFMNRFILPKGTYMSFSGTVKIGDNLEIGKINSFKIAGDERKI